MLIKKTGDIYKQRAYSGAEVVEDLKAFSG